MPGPTENRTNAVAGYAPPSTIALVAGNDYGATLNEPLDLYEKDPALQGRLCPGRAGRAAMLGGLDAIVGWMGDTGVVVDKHGTPCEGGIVVDPGGRRGSEAAADDAPQPRPAGRRQLGYRRPRRDVQRADDHDRRSWRRCGTSSAWPAPSAASLPAIPQRADGHRRSPTSRPTRSSSIGSSPDFVKHVLDAGAGASLADDARFQGLLERVGAKHTGVELRRHRRGPRPRRGRDGRRPGRRAGRVRTVDQAVPDAVRRVDRRRAPSAATVDQTHCVITVK